MLIFIHELKLMETPYCILLQKYHSICFLATHIPLMPILNSCYEFNAIHYDN